MNTWPDVLVSTILRLLMCLGCVYLVERFADSNEIALLLVLLLALVLFEVFRAGRPR